MSDDLDSVKRFGHGLLAAVVLSIVIVVCVWALAEAYLNAIR